MPAPSPRHSAFPSQPVSSLLQPFTRLLLLCAPAYDHAGLLAARDHLLALGLGIRTAQTARICWGEWTGHACAHRLTSLAPLSPHAPDLALARHALLAEPSPGHARLRLERYLTRERGLGVDAATIDAEVAIRTACALAQDQADVQDLWDQVYDLPWHGTPEVSSTLDRAVGGLLSGELSAGSRTEPTVTALLLTALRVAFVQGEAPDDAGTLTRALHALTLDSVHPDAWHFGKAGALHWHVTAFRERAYYRLQWHAARTLLENGEAPPQGRRLFLAALLSELERLSREERPMPSPPLHREAQSLMVQMLAQAAQSGVPTRAAMQRQLAAQGTPGAALLSRRLAQLTAHHQPQPRAPRRLGLGTPPSGPRP